MLSFPRRVFHGDPQPSVYTGRQPSLGRNQRWPVRGRKAFALERIDWTGRMPLKSSKCRSLRKDFQLLSPSPLIAVPESIRNITACRPSPIFITADMADPKSIRRLGCEERDFVGKWQVGEHRGSGIKPVIVYEFDLGELRDAEKTTLLHRHAYYTVNEIPEGK